MATINIGFCDIVPNRLAGDAKDSTLIAQAQRGNLRAFDELVRRYDKAVLRLAMRLTRSEHEAQDIYQEAFFKAYRNLSKFRGESSFYSWIYRIVSNLCLDRLRRQRRRQQEEHVLFDVDGQQFDFLEHLADPNPERNPERAIMQKELQRHIQYALRRLTARERMVFELKHYEGLRLRAVGEILNTTEETAKNTLFRATHKLRGYLQHMRAL